MKKNQPLCLFISLCMLILLAGCTIFGSHQPDTYIEPVTGMEFTLVPGGCFQMGNLWGKGDLNEEPVHRVCLDDYYLARTEVTQSQWTKVMGENPSYFQKGETFPVETVSWHDANTFLQKLSQNHEQTFRLPTEAEWEYACRSGGKEERYCGGDDLKERAWFDRTGGGTTQPVATRQPNGLGLYDLSGNVWEFCSDTYAKDYYSISPEKNPQGAEEGPHVIKRGGSWSINPRYLRSSVRGRAARHDKHYSTGFRVAISTRH